MLRPFLSGESDTVTVALAARGITKQYGPLVAVDRSDFTLEKGEIHVLLGTNGCGKSTLCKVVAGAVPANEGTIELDGRAVTFRTPLEARRAGIATVYQELSLNPTQSVAENIYLGQEPRRFGMIDRRGMLEAATALLRSLGDLGQNVAAGALVGDLSIDQKQIVEIAKALVQKPAVILFDESTSSLDLAQVKAFFALVRRLRDEGCSIIFISHRMEEIFAIGDRVTVMRSGRCIATRRLAETDRHQLVALMVGEEIAAADARAPRVTPAGATTPVLSLRGLANARLRALDLDLFPGEIVGLGGLHGQGQSDLLLAVFGAEARPAGSVAVAGRGLGAGGAAAALRAGLTYVSGDRGRDGALHGRPILENLAASALSKGGSPALSPAALRAQVTPITGRMRLKFGGYDDEIGTLSGGNQQKVMIGRALATAPRVLLLDDPTKGIDVRAKRDLFDLIRGLCAEGMAVILYSSEDAELLENADRILVFNSGAVVDTLEGARLTEFDLYAAALKSAA